MNATAAQTKSLEWLNRLRANPKIPLIVTGFPRQWRSWSH